MRMTDWLLGLIALGTLTTALLQVIVIVSLFRVGRRVLARLERIKAMLAPLPAHLVSASAELSRARSLLEHRMRRVSAVYSVIEPPLRQGFAAAAVVSGARRLLRRGPRAR